MSHSSKIDSIKEAKRYNYKTYLYFVCIDGSEINVSIVENRVAKGGHFVEEGKIKGRYFKTLNNLFSAIEIEQADKTYLFDNSKETITLIAKIINGKLTLEIDPDILPGWFINYVLKYYI